MSPADERLILLPPRRALVGGVAHDPGGAKPRHGQRLGHTRLNSHQDELPLDVLAGVVALAPSSASVIGAASQLAIRTVGFPEASNSQSSAKSAFQAGRERWVP